MPAKKKIRSRPKGKSPIGKVKQGALRKSLGISTSDNMPEKDKIIHKGDSALMKKRKIFAQNAAKWNKAK